jgi:sterol desaturase/sphingolipid hydroxylase (fatty acid hydroxylase superfamily)
MHKVPFLWEFHKIHHSATTLNPITQYRLHPVELILNNLSYFVVSAILMGVGDYFYQGVINQAVYAEVNIFAMLFLFWGSNLRHSHVKLRYFNFVERLVISPFQHQIHHSNNPAHFDKNLGAKFALWDWLFGTLIRSEKQKTLRFGLGSKESSHYDTFLKTLYQPFKKIFTWSKNQ